jgi:heavy metal sensor kinase
MSFANLSRKRPLTIGLRLTLWGAGITLFVCLLLCVILYLGLGLSLQHEVDVFLEGEVDEFVAILNEHGQDYAATQESVRVELGNRIRRDLSFRLLDREGNVLLTSDTEAHPAGLWAPPTGREPSGTRPVFHTVRIAGTPAPYRLCSRRFSRPGTREYVAQAGYRLDQMTTSLARFRQICLFALAAAGLAALGGGRAIANRSLQPVQAMIAKARQIGEHRLEERLPVRGTGDELDRLARTINEMLDRVGTYVRRMQQFTADASHELRSPLAALRGNAEVMLTRQRTAEELRQAIEDNLDHYNRLSRIAEDLLWLARIDAGENVLVLERVRLDEAIADVVELYQPLAADRGLDLSIRETQAIWASVDGGRIRQLFGNLIDNAVKYTRTPGRVEVRVLALAGEVQVSVRDTGIGIPAEALGRVFDRFFRVDPARATGKAGGAGLGLAISRSIVEAHGGRITLSSTPGEGTTILVNLPADAGPAA